MQAIQTNPQTHPRLSRQDIAALYDLHADALYRYAFRLLGDEDLAEECVAETFSRLITAVKGGGGPGENPRAYLYRVAHNWITDTYRRQSPTDELDPNLASTASSNPAVLVSRRIEQERLRSALFQLTAEQRQVIALRFLEDMSHEQISAVIGKTAEATRALQHRAVAALRALLKE